MKVQVKWWSSGTELYLLALGLLIHALLKLTAMAFNCNQIQKRIAGVYAYHTTIKQDI